jgi:heme exporter protein D|tara:strand:- start:4257 stop:4487 length:231 start_codon:yes stop_codon:yes gene_type:complete
MISDLISMNGYGAYVWTAFAFTLIGFSCLYFIIKVQLKKEQKRFEENFSMLTEEKYNVASNQDIYKEILKDLNAKI